MSMTETTRAAAALLISATLAHGQLAIYVDVNNPCPGSGFQADPFCMIQTAIGVASDGDEVVVAPGTYHEQINFLGKAIAVRGTAGADVTIIDAGGSGPIVTCDSAESSDTVLEGFTVSGGDSAGMSNGSSSPTVTNCVFSGNTGGGMYNSNNSPTVTNCTFSGNSNNYNGGGMYNNNSSPAVTNCTFSKNSTNSNGGGMYNSDSSPTVTNCTFSENSTNYNGGGMYNAYSSPTMTNCTFSENFTNSNSNNSNGGGMYNTYSSSPAVTNCTFSGNSALDGGGMYNSDSSPTLTNCVFSGNTATDALAQGGGMYNRNSSPTLTGCTVSGNTPEGMHTWLGSSPTINNSVFWGNALAQITTVIGSPVTVSFSDVEGGLADGTVDGGGNIIDDPEFIDGFHLSETSPCIDRGDPDFIPGADETDIDGDPRVINGRVDMGADEYAGNFGVCGNGVIEAGEDCDPPDGVTCDEGCHLIPDGDVDDDGVLNDDDVCDNTPPDTPVDAEGRPLGDIDLDCDVDLLDFRLLQDSFTGVIE